MADNTKERTQAEAQFKKTQKQQEGAAAMAAYVAEADAVRAKTAWRTSGLDRAHFFLEGGAMKFIENSAITTKAYWLRVYRSCPNFAQ